MANITLNIHDIDSKPETHFPGMGKPPESPPKADVKPKTPAKKEEKANG